MPKAAEVILYQEDGFDAQKIRETVTKTRSIHDYAFILHDQDVDEKGNLKKPHIHLYLSFGNTNVSFESVAKWFGVKGNQVERIKSRRRIDVILYYLHWKNPEKHQYPLDALVSNLDVKALLENEQQKVNLAEIIRKCADGIITPYNFTDYISPEIYAINQTKINRAWEFFAKKQARAMGGQRSCDVIWVHGHTGVGKTTVCMLAAKEQGLPVYKSATGNDPFSKYGEEPIVILDDLRANRPFSYNDLLQILDPYYVAPTHRRYHDVVLNCDTIFITSVYSPQAMVEEYALNGVDSAEQLYRRISEVWCLTNDYINISRYDMDRHAFIPKDMTPNPVADYKATLPKKTTIDGASLLRAVADRYSAPQMSLFDDNYNGNIERMVTNE